MSLRILQLIETGGPGGAETVFASLSSGLASRGHAVQCATGAGSWLPGELKRRLLASDVLQFQGSFDRPLLRQIQALIKAHRADVVHAHLFDGGVYAGLASRLLGVPCVVTLHGQVDVATGGWRAALKRRLLVHSGRRIVTVSHALQRDLSTAFGTVARDFTVIHNGVAAPSTFDINRAFAWDVVPHEVSSPLRVLAVGNIRRPKGYPILLEAVALLKRRGVAVRLDVAGEADTDGLFESLQALAHTLGISADVTFHGFVSNPASLIAACDVFTLASTQEGFSLVTIEAMALGTPVVATRSGGPEEILTDGVTGVLVEAGSAAALADGILRIGADPAHTRQMIARAHTEALHRFSLDAMISAYETLYHQTINSRR
jgi:glycosyltransferase involved in cell wall biosynthesis